MAVKRYDGSDWVTVAGKGDTGATGADGTAPLTTKGDLLTFGTSATRLAVGTNNYVLTADSGETTGLKWAAAAGGDTFAAGKNKIINGDFKINQRAHTSSTSAGYTFDRFFTNLSGGTVTHSVETFTPGTAPVTGYEGATFYRCVTSGQSAAGDFALLDYAVESVRTFANQATVISFWAKAASGTPKIAFELQQNFGSGGSPSSSVLTYAGDITLSTTWTRYSLTYTVPSISGKTLGTTHDGFLKLRLWLSAGSTYDARTGTLGIQSNTFDIWGVQWEAGSTATDFQTATGTLQGELAACQRYFQVVESSASYAPFAMAFAFDTNTGMFVYHWKVKLRANPTVTYSAAGDFATYDKDVAVTAASSIAVERVGTEALLGAFDVATTPYTGGEAFVFLTNAGAGAKIYASSEL